jgi:pimeloyl-ACP methyl ester carboxylesterase
VEGGPGYPSTLSRDGYLDLFAPLRDRRDMLLVDQRGTGKSGALDCPLLQRESTALGPGIRDCGAQLGNRAYLYGSALAADDLAAILDALGIAIIDLYGDSYGTFLSQTFAGRHPDRLRSVVLDSAYPPVGQSPWYPEIGTTARFAFNAACERSATCRNRPGSSMARIAQLAEELRAHPFVGDAFDGDGTKRRTRADATNLDYLMVSNGTTSVVYRELDAAARAYLENQNSAPLLRLMAENRFASQSGGSEPPEYSEALFLSVSCSDYPQIYDMRLPLDARRIQRNQSVLAQQQRWPNVYAPFTISEFAAMPLDTSVLNLCLEWPTPAISAYPPGHPLPPHARFTDAPVLVLSGDLDSLTPALQAKHSAELFAHSQQVIVQNSFHVTAVGDEDNCASRLVQRFLRELDPGDTSCAQNAAEVHLVPQFVENAADVDPASALPGNTGTDADLRLAAAAAYTVGDALARWWVNYSGFGVGLRGGTFSYRSPSNLTFFTLDHLRWVNDLAVSGNVAWHYNYPGGVTATATLSGNAGQLGRLTMTWQSRAPNAQANIIGTLLGRRIVATMYAP